MPSTSDARLTASSFANRRMSERPAFVRQTTDATPAYEMGDVKEMDLEKDTKEPYSAVTSDDDIQHGEVEYKADALTNKYMVFRKLKQSELWLDSKLGGVETRGVNRIPEEEKEPPQLLNAFLMWFSLNVHVGVIPLGVLGPEFGLTLGQSIACAVGGTMLGATCTAACGTLGPKLGLRAIATSRYSFGYYGAKLCSIMNILVGGGFGVVNYVVVGQILSAVSDFKLTITVGIVIIAVVSYIVSIFGFKVVHTFEKYSWIYTLIIFFVLYAQTAPYVVADAPAEYGQDLAWVGQILSIISINFSNASGWCSIASDYYCNYPAKTPKWLVFALTWFGIVIPTSISVILGSMIGNAYVNNESTADQTLYLAYTTDSHGLGGLLAVILHPVGWSKFALVLLTFSVLGNNIAINYSSGLSLQLLGHYFHAIPRYIWSLGFVIVVAVIAIAGQANLSADVNNFVSLLGYWTVSFTIVLMIEDLYFRKTEGYNLFAWDNPKKLPIGVAGVTALLAGYLAGGVPGMAQVWFVGPIAAKFGLPYGGDVGIYMSAAITLVWYPIARTIEKKYMGR